MKMRALRIEPLLVFPAPVQSSWEIKPALIIILGMLGRGRGGDCNMAAPMSLYIQSSPFRHDVQIWITGSPYSLSSPFSASTPLLNLGQDLLPDQPRRHYRAVLQRHGPDDSHKRTVQDHLDTGSFEIIWLCF